MVIPKLYLFDADVIDDVLVVTANRITGTYRYNDLHLDCNSLRSYIVQAGVKKLIFDLATLSYFGSELMAGLILIARECERHGGQVALCSVSHYATESLAVIRFFDNHPKHETIHAALQAFDVNYPARS